MDFETAKDHIGRRTLLELDARDFMTDPQRDRLSFRIGDRESDLVRRVEIGLGGDDHYTVEVGRIHLVSMEWITEQLVTGIGCENLSETVKNLVLAAGCVDIPDFAQKAAQMAEFDAAYLERRGRVGRR